MAEEVEKIGPAERASIECLGKVYQAIDDKRNFLVEAGAGAGKTYTLIKALKYLIDKHEIDYQKVGKKIACITYTNVAKDEIRSRTDNHPIILADTIHAFAWQVIQGFQKALRDRIVDLGDRWIERIEQAGGVKQQEVIYNLGYPKITENEIFLHHNDVIKLFTSLLNDKKFRRVFSNKYPVILIDEYQDTDKALAAVLVEKFIDSEGGCLIGFFGDHWQKIYGTASCGMIEAAPEKLVTIGKQANFRSDKRIVEVLNRMRPELTQHECDPDSMGEVIVLHTNNWNGDRRTGAHWNGDLPAEDAHSYLEATKARLNREGWNIQPESTKVLMLTNNVLASEQGYENVAAVFSESDDYLKKNDDYIAFLTDTVEIGSDAFERKKYGEMMDVFRLKTSTIKRHSDKESWHESLTALTDLRRNGTVGDVIDLLNRTSKPRLPRRIEEKEQRFQEIGAIAEEERSEGDKRLFARIGGIRSIPYVEVSNVAKYIEDKTLYSTKHGVKGAEFENVIVVLGRGWNHYNWNQFLEWVHLEDVPAASRDTYERNRNLFYVACSRARKRLCLLFTQELSPNAMAVLQDWFGNVITEIEV